MNSFQDSLVFFTFLLFLTLPVVAFALLLIYLKKRAAKENAKWIEWSSQNGYEYAANAVSTVLSLSSFNDGQIARMVGGGVKEVGNKFTVLLQTETRGSGKSRRVYSRTIIAIVIPDTRLQIIINSKINNDASSGGNIARFTNDERFSLEGDFGDFYDVYMPATTQSETLSMLTPDSMLYILENMIDYDIEINGSLMYLYAYNHQSLEKIGETLNKLPLLLEEMRLRDSDTRQEPVSNALVARTAVGVTKGHRKLKKNFGLTGIILLITYVAFEITQNVILGAILATIFLYFIITVLIQTRKERGLRRKYHNVIVAHKSPQQTL